MRSQAFQSPNLVPFSYKSASISTLSNKTSNICSLASRLELENICLRKKAGTTQLASCRSRNTKSRGHKGFQTGISGFHSSRELSRKSAETRKSARRGLWEFGKGNQRKSKIEAMGLWCGAKTGLSDSQCAVGTSVSSILLATALVCSIQVLIKHFRSKSQVIHSQP